MTSSALRKFEKHPHSWTFTTTTPLGHCPCDVIHIPRGGGVITPVTHTHPGSATGVHLRSTSKKRGGGPTLGPMLKSLHRGPKGGGGGSGPPPPWIRHCRYWSLLNYDDNFSEASQLESEEVEDLRGPLAVQHKITHKTLAGVLGILRKPNHPDLPNTLGHCLVQLPRYRPTHYK